jgi:hypothetical protein
MKLTMNRYSTITARITALLAVIGILFSLGCNSKNADGAFLIVELENSENVKQYSVFNPYVHSIEECNASAKTAIEQILSSDPMVVPKDSVVKSWRCSLLPPERGG